MSGYSDKHPHVATCTVATCDNDGIELKIIRGVLGWYCEQHKDLK